MIQTGRRRRYKTVTVIELDGGFGVALDGKPLNTPKRQPMLIPTRRLAEAIASEWRAQGEDIYPATMPLTRLAGSAIDLVSTNRAEVIERTTAYAGTDLLCYRAEGPPPLVERQQTGWQPLLDWAARHFDVPLRVTRGVIAVEQPATALLALRQIIEQYDDMRLTALAAATAACGSLILALAMAKGRLDAEATFVLSQLDESYQIELWGEDSEAATRRATLKADIVAAGQFLALLGP